MVRKLGEAGEKGPVIVLFFSVFSCVVVLPWMIFDYHPMTWQQMGILLLAGCAAAGGQFAITAHTAMPRRAVFPSTIIRS